MRDGSFGASARKGRSACVASCTNSASTEPAIIASLAQVKPAQPSGSEGFEPER